MKTIREMLDDIRKRNIVLPEFQREYVWNREQAKQLLVSLYKKYPVGGLLLWNTDKPPKLKNIDKLPEKLGTVQVLLDGQQRLTTLHMLTTGDIPAYYTEAEIRSDPRDLFFHLESADFQYYQSSRMAGDPMWHKVIECFTDQDLNVMAIADAATDDANEKFKLAQTLNNNLNQLRSIREHVLPEQVVPSHASLNDAIDIFDRVNSQGTKLTDAELALTHITGKWPYARRVMKLKLEECGELNFHFGLSFLTRALTATVTGRALFETIHTRPREELEEGWARVNRTIDYLINLLPRQAFIHSTSELSTTNALIPIIAYLTRNEGAFPNQKSILHAVNWFYSALLWARYTAQTDQRLEADLSIIAKEVEPWDLLRNQIVDQRGRIDVKASDFEGRTAQHPLYRLTLVLSKAHSAVDWFNGVPLGVTHGAAYAMHSHHIFPQGLLYRSGWDSDNYMHRQAVNEIANRAFLTAASNLSLSDTQPSDYLPEVEDKYPGALASQFIPMDPSLWNVARYRDFLEARRELLALKMNEFRDALITEPEDIGHRSIQELIALGESMVLEFKSTLQWDVLRNRRNKELRHSVLKTIAAFMNSEGGTLIIGIEDNGDIFGLDKDLNLLGGSLDRFGQTLSNLIVDRIGAATMPYVDMRFDEVEGQSVCVVSVEPFRDGVFLKGVRGKEFFVRAGNTSRSLDPEQTHEYLNRR